MTQSTGGPSLRGPFGRPRLAVVIALSVVSCWTGCAGPLKQIGSEASLVSRAAGFDPGQVDNQPVAVLSAVVSFGLEGYAHQVSRSLHRALLTEPIAIQARTPQLTLSRINQGGLAKDYSDMIAAHLQSGILNRATLRAIGEAAQAQFVFLPMMAWFEQSMSERFSFFGIRLLQTRVSILRLSLELWNTQTGELVWESSGEATLAGEDVREYRIPFEEIAEQLWAQLLVDLKRPRTVPHSPSPLQGGLSCHAPAIGFCSAHRS